MNAERLLEEFDRLTEVPGAVGRLRAFVYQLAVRGALCSLETSDEPVTNLLARISSARSNAVSGSRATSAGAPLSLPFELPSHWAAVPP